MNTYVLIVSDKFNAMKIKKRGAIYENLSAANKRLKFYRRIA